MKVNDINYLYISIETNRHARMDICRDNGTKKNGNQASYIFVHSFQRHLVRKRHVLIVSSLQSCKYV